MTTEPLPRELPDGPWKDEPDRKEWRHAGLPCLILRNALGALCGYAAVPPGHPLYGKAGDDLDVHGGVTFTGHCEGKICHEAKPGEPDEVYWFGFDCAHFMDLVPGLLPEVLFKRIPEAIRMTRPVPSIDVYRSMAYVTSEVERLAEQLAALAGDGRPHGL